jgi:hypothetical protein
MWPAVHESRPKTGSVLAQAYACDRAETAHQDETIEVELLLEPDQLALMNKRIRSHGYPGEITPEVRSAFVVATSLSEPRQAVLAGMLKAD